AAAAARPPRADTAPALRPPRPAVRTTDKSTRPSNPQTEKARSEKVGRLTFKSPNHRTFSLLTSHFMLQTSIFFEPVSIPASPRRDVRGSAFRSPFPTPHPCPDHHPTAESLLRFPDTR